MGSLAKLGSISQGQLNASRKRQTSKIDETFNIDPKLLPNGFLVLDYQRKWLSDPAKVSVDEKSRQIGWSWTMALRSILRGIFYEKDTIYTSYNKDSAKQFTKDCKYWAKLLNYFFHAATGQRIINDRNINVFEIVLNNGASIQASAGNSENLRGKPGYDIIIDEAAYREEKLEEDILKAANATLIHGGTIKIGSTHNGIGSDFHKLVEKVKSGELPYGYSKVTFRDAVNQGLYKRILAKQENEIWTPAKELAWVKEIYDMYGARAVEELDVVPSDYRGANKVIQREKIQIVDYIVNPINCILFRYYDLAASIKEEAYYSADVQIAFDLTAKVFVITDWFAKQLNPTDADNHIEETVRNDPPNSMQIIELEPGSTGSKYINYMRQKCDPFTIFEYAPKISKLYRAFPVGTAFAKGEMFISSALGERAGQLADLLCQFDGSRKVLVNDVTDCVTGIYDFVKHSDQNIAYGGMFG